MKSLFLFAVTSLCLGSAAYANTMPLPQGSVYADCVAEVGREGCAALAMAWSLCNKKIDESRRIERKIDRISGEYLDILAAMNIKENDLLNANFNYSGIVTESSAGIMHEVCPSVLKSEEGARPMFVANLETMVFGVYRQNMLRVMLMEAKADADCKYQVTYDNCLRARKESYFKTFFLNNSTGIDK